METIKINIELKENRIIKKEIELKVPAFRRHGETDFFKIVDEKTVIRVIIPYKYLTSAGINNYSTVQDALNNNNQEITEEEFNQAFDEAVKKLSL